MPAPRARVSATAMMTAAAAASRPELPRGFEHLPVPPPGVLPQGAKGMAQDQCISASTQWAMTQVSGQAALFSAVGGFIGYPYLAELAQLPEYRMIAEKIAKSMTRNWIRLTSTGSDAKSAASKAEKLRELEAEMKRFRVQGLFREAAEQDGFFGLSHIYIDTGVTEAPDLLSTPLVIDPKTIKQGSLKALKPVEPIWTYPAAYDSTNPLRQTFYQPQSWFVMGKTVHASRLLTFVGRQVPDILKPAYNFGGLSLTQMAMPYVNNWIRTRTSVGDLVHNFSVMNLGTDLQTLLSEGDLDGAASLLARAQLFNQTRDNRGLMMTNKETEELTNVAVPLGTLDKLQAQAQEQIASVTGIPLVVLLGITPSGLNASSEGEIRVFYDWIKSMQEELFTANLTRVLQILQLNRFGEVDEEIGFEFEPLWQLDEVARATVRKTQADTAAVHIASGVIDPAEERERLATEEGSAYPALDLNKEIEPPDAEEPEDIEGDPAAGEGGRSEEREI